MHLSTSPPPRRTLAAGLLALAALSACTAPTVVEAEEVPQRHKALTNEYVVMDNASELAGAIVLEQVTEDRNASPRIVQFNIRNRSKEPYDFMYKCLWLDDGGMEIQHSLDVWNKRTILGRQRMNLRCPAPNLRATDYRLVMKHWKR